VSDLSTFPVTTKWKPQNADVIQLFSYPTPNGVKVSIALEELGLPYEAHTVTLSDADVKSPEYLSLNPNNKIPAIIDPQGPDGTPISLWESRLIAEGVFTAADAKQISSEAMAEASEAADFADQSAPPTIEDVQKHVYWETDNETEASKIGRHFFND